MDQHLAGWFVANKMYMLLFLFLFVFFFFFVVVVVLLIQIMLSFQSKTVWLFALKARMIGLQCRVWRVSAQSAATNVEK